MTYLTVETRELEDLRRKHSVACGVIAEQSATIKLLESEVAYLRRLVTKAINKVGAGGAAA